jgi:serine/threonine protein kinase
MSSEIPHSEAGSGPNSARLRELFETVSELEGEARRSFLADKCADDPELLAALLNLLRADENADLNPFWSRSAIHAVADAGVADTALPFETLGPYRILERLGAGGMGVVYLAEGDYDGVRKRVAIKAMPWAFDDQMVRRFHQERRIVASLEHPNIARMLDAGTTPQGVPYLVMEYVDGVPLNRYASDHDLSRDARLSLFRSVCDAVAYAHRNLIVHRDLKPGNILVTEDGAPKLLDFGIASLMGEPRPDFTGPLQMTAAYASPEQLAGQNITTASDIYSLGVILFELLTGEKPGGGKRLEGDIGNVVAMALRPEPERRYASAADLSEDVRRVRELYPVAARRDSPGYRLRKFVSRRPVETGIVMALSIAAIVAGSIAFEQYRAASRRFNEVRGIANSFLFEVYDSIGDLPGATRTRMVVAKRAQQYLDVLAQDRSSDPALQHELAAAYLRLGDILGRPNYPNLGDNDGALANYRNATVILEGLAAAHPEDAAALRDLGRIYGREGRIAIRRNSLDEALADDDRSVAMLERAASLPGAPREARIGAIDASLDAALAHLEVGEERVDMAHVATGESLAGRAKSASGVLLRQGPGDASLRELMAKSCEYLAFAQSILAKLTDSQEYRVRAAGNFQERLDFYRDGSDRKAADAYVEAASGWRNAGDAPRAEAAARQGLRLFEEIAVNDPSNREAALDVLTAHFTMGDALSAGHRGAEAAAHFRKFLEGEGQAPGVQHDRATSEAVVEVRDEMADYYRNAGRRSEAIALYRENIQALSGTDKPSRMVSLALEYELLAGVDAAQAEDCQAKASELWARLRDLHRLPPRYASKATPR